MFNPFGSCGSNRFEARRYLGEGAMGVVYEAYDRERNSVVALKRLLRVDAPGIYRLKQEFRALADIVHPNLVTLHELVHESGEWFLVMEHIQGVGFLRYVRPDVLEALEATVSMEGDIPIDAPGVDCPDASLLPDGLDVDRLRGALFQLAEGLETLHQHGKLHRDIKPSNVLVTDADRVVILDFGLVGGGEHDRLLATVTEHGAMGTPAYMAPEQAAGQRATAASDWYAVGVMLYRALTGRLPFSGSILEVLQAKQVEEPTSPSALTADVPRDLEALCLELLSRDARARPNGQDIVHRLGHGRATDIVSMRPLQVSQPPAFVGRTGPLAIMEEAYRASTQGQPVVLFVRGQAGIGKTALVTQFLDKLRNAHQAVILPGRCYECETVPFKAFDCIIDALSRYLNGLPGVEAAEVMPRDIKALAQLFPVLRRVRAVARSRRRGEIDDPIESRQRAFQALKDMLCRIADTSPLVVYVDDLHWGDEESAALLAEVLRPPDPPPLLFVGVYREEDEPNSPFLRAWEGARKPLEGNVTLASLAIDALPHAQARDLALALLKDANIDASTVAEAIAVESQGVPLFVGALARHVLAVAQRCAGVDTHPTCRALDLRLDLVLQTRIAQLEPDARRLLEAIAVAGRPVTQGGALACAGLGKEGRATIALLRSEHWIRTRGGRIGDAVEVYHERMRDAVLASVDPGALCTYRARLADADASEIGRERQGLRTGRLDGWRAFG